MSEFNEKTAWHTMDIDEVLSTLMTSSSGLSQFEAERRLTLHGRNMLVETSQVSALKRFLLQFHHLLIYVLLGSAVITASLQHWIDTAVILVVVIANALIGFIQESKAEKALEAIRYMLAPKASVIREGERRSIPSEQLVPGDVILIEAGDKIPADLRLMTAHQLMLQEAILTGESLAVEKRPHPVAINSALGDRKCMAYSGTTVASGQAKGVVVATGEATEVGRISGMLSSVVSLTTPLLIQLNLFAKWLTLVILVFAVLLLGFSFYAEHHDFPTAFMAVVGLFVAAIPEGLPAVLTITMAIGVQAMARRNAIVRYLPAIETLGGVSVICSDKTGTLTRNEMMVKSLVTRQQIYSLDGDGYAPVGNIAAHDPDIFDQETGCLALTARVAAHCNDALLHEQASVWQVEGDPMEGALLAMSGKLQAVLNQSAAIWVRQDVIPFDASYRYMVTLNANHQGELWLFAKGAPEQLIELCDSEWGGNGISQLPLNREYWHAQASLLAKQGQRVLALAAKPVGPDQTKLHHQHIHSGLGIVALVGLMDTPRAEAIAAIAECDRAGIQVKMITGDHALTASAIGKQLGLHNPENVLTGSELDLMDNSQLHEAVLNTSIFARTSPEHKLRLVMALQSHSMTVAMTGDGVNDAPALKRADVGIAMGKKGSEVTKEAADIILTDDNFASIVAAVREGRTVYDNIKKLISWTLPTNAGEALVVATALMSGWALPITPIQILWINLITAVTLGLALAFEPTEPKTMLRPPRKQHEPLISMALAWHIVFVSIIFLVAVFGVYQHMLLQQHSVALARTVALNTLVVMEMFHLFYIRNIHGTSLSLKGLQGTKIVWSVVCVILLAQAILTYWGAAQTIFGTHGLEMHHIGMVVLIGFTFLLILEAEKYMRKKLARIVKGILNLGIT